MYAAYSAQRIFDGEQWLTNHAILIRKQVIEAVVPVEQLPANGPHTSYGARLLLPAFIDVQVYGAAKKLFSVYPNVNTLQVMQQQFATTGTAIFQPTVATNTMEVFKKCIDAVRAYWQQGGAGVHGLHLEGPWINPEKKGAHVSALIHTPELKEVEEILNYGKGVITMITMAPEVCSKEVIALIRSHDIILSAGHSNASYEQAMQCFEAGFSLVTHLYNAMSPLHHRNAGLVGAAFQHPSVCSSIIPDGYHTSYAAVAIAKNAMGNRLFAITDAVTETQNGPYRHQLAGEKYECNGTLSGSALSMYKAFCNLVHHVNLPVAEAHRMCSLYPAQALGLQNRYGKLAPGYSGKFIVLQPELQWVAAVTTQA